MLRSIRQQPPLGFSPLAKRERDSQKQMPNSNEAGGKSRPAGAALPTNHPRCLRSSVQAYTRYAYFVKWSGMHHPMEPAAPLQEGPRVGFEPRVGCGSVAAPTRPTPWVELTSTSERGLEKLDYIYLGELRLMATLRITYASFTGHLQARSCQYSADIPAINCRPAHCPRIFLQGICNHNLDLVHTVFLLLPNHDPSQHHRVVATEHCIARRCWSVYTYILRKRGMLPLSIRRRIFTL